MHPFCGEVLQIQSNEFRHELGIGQQIIHARPMGLKKLTPALVGLIQHQGIVPRLSLSRAQGLQGLIFPLPAPVQLGPAVLGNGVKVQKVRLTGKFVGAVGTIVDAHLGAIAIAVLFAREGQGPVPLGERPAGEVMVEIPALRHGVEKTIEGDVIGTRLKGFKPGRALESRGRREGQAPEAEKA